MHSPGHAQRQSDELIDYARFDSQFAAQFGSILINELTAVAN